MKRTLVAIGTILLVLVGWTIVLRLNAEAPRASSAQSAMPSPVEVADVETGPIRLERTYSGTLEAAARFVVSPKIGGTIERMRADLSDPVRKGQVIAELDDAEYRQSVAQAAAELEVAEATVLQTTRALAIAGRELRRLESLREQQVASESQLDAAIADESVKSAALAVSRAQVGRANAALESARIRLGYTRVTADWSGSDALRVVSERFADEGGTVSANTPLLAIVSLDPIVAVVFVTEQDYPKLRVDQPVQLTTDAYGKRAFGGRIDRIAPVFRQNSRQARVEITVSNSDNLLKPGMFVRAEALLDQVDSATIVPLDALVTRDGQEGLFVVLPEGDRVRWHPVRVGIRNGNRVQVSGAGIEGRVVTLGQQLIDDGSRIVIPEVATPTAELRP